MQRRYSEPNTYIDTLPSNPHNSDELYDDVTFTADPEVCFSAWKHKWSHDCKQAAMNWPHALCTTSTFHLGDLKVAGRDSD